MPAPQVQIERHPGQAPGRRYPPTILVAVASLEERSWTVGQAIAEALTQRGSDVDLMQLGAGNDADLDPSAYDAVVLGSDVRSGRWLRAARLFIAEHTAALNTRPVWVFSNSTTTDTQETSRGGVRIYGVVIATNPVDHRILPADNETAMIEAISTWAGEINEATAQSACGAAPSSLTTTA